MQALLHALISIFLIFSIHSGVTESTETSPADAAAAFLDGIVSCSEDVTSRYAGNDYIDFLANTRTDARTLSDMDQALFKNLSYRIVKTASSESYAVARVDLTGNDFSKAMKKYDKAATEYVTDNFYDEDVADSDKLEKKCLDIYVEQLQELSDEDPDLKTTIYIPMKSDGYGGWTVIISDDIMKALLGNISLPEDK